MVTDVAVVGFESGLRYLGARLGSPERAETWPVIDGWPPKAGPVHDLVPLSTPDHRSLCRRKRLGTMSGLEIVRPGHFFSDGFAITYRLNGRTDHYVLQSQSAVCTPRFVRADGHCPVP
ncbi:MAG TPA: hypothetical protein VFQ19_09655 [Nocardioidaceae bacterium]|nr:hypothetical protein [Nocardioidaceae bacterium]